MNEDPLHTQTCSSTGLVCLCTLIFWRTLRSYWPAQHRVSLTGGQGSQGAFLLLIFVIYCEVDITAGEAVVLNMTGSVC